MEKGMKKEKNNTDKLKFEGEFLNEERNGKGIEYIHDIGSFFQNDNDDDNNYIIGIGRCLKIEKMII